MERGLARRESVDTEMHKSEEKRKTFVYTKKRGYDVTRNPHLNKVTDGMTVRFLACSINKLADAFEDCRNFYRCHGTACVSVKEFCVCVDAKPTYNASLANVNRHIVEYFLYSITHYHMLNATVLAGAVNAALAWWYQLCTRLYLDLKICVVSRSCLDLQRL